MRKGLVILILFLSFFSFISLAMAEDFDSGEVISLATNMDKCNAILGDPNKEGDVAYYLQIILDVFKYGGIALCVALSVTDAFKAIMGDDKQMYKPVVKKIAMRVFYAVALWFLPPIVETLLGIFGIYGTCSIG